MLDLFICHLNPSAMRRLAQKLEEDGGNSEIRRYCERILRARSTGWTQGIFANFAAESMVPKGPEWGGGNWEIKTPTNLKDIPQWELAAEVMPYMKTDDGAIPSIIADHIGVYLGSIKGRGNIVAVREDSLVKVLTPARSDSKPNGIQTSLVKSTSNKSKGVVEGDTKAESLMGLETLTKQYSATAADEQAKAEEEFKKTMYGAADEGSSSDEEGVSKRKRLQIRIRDKPVASPVDVNKIKEATRQFKLGEGLVPSISRTKSLDIGQSLSQPSAPSTGGMVTGPTGFSPVSAPADIFGTDVLLQPAPGAQPGPAVTGMGVTAGPIPEDFFQNTVSSLQVAAQLLPPGTYLSKMGEAARGVETGKATASQVNTSVADIGLADGGVPPQASQQPAVSLDSIGLPDGGIPPQSGAHTVVVPQPQAQVPISTQPLDLSVLGVSASMDSGKPVHPASPPASVRPGQVNINYLHKCAVNCPMALWISSF